MRAFTNKNPKSLEGAVRLLSGGLVKGREVTLVGGGSDLLGMIKESLATPDVLVNLKALKGHDGIEDRSDGVHIGGLITLDALSRHSLIRSKYRVLAEAAQSVATPQIRNVATLAGNVCQRPWCWYYRQGFPCFKNGGNSCFSVVGENQFNAILGGGPSFIVHPSDTAPALLALDATFRVRGPEKERAIPASEFFILPEVDVTRENRLEPDEVLIEIRLPKPKSDPMTTYVKVMDRQAWTHAVVSLAVTLEMNGGVCRKAAIVLGGVAPIPWRAVESEKVVTGKPLTPKLAAEAGAAAVADALPLRKNAYKVALAEALVRRTLLSLEAQL